MPTSLWRAVQDQGDQRVDDLVLSLERDATERNPYEKANHAYKEPADLPSNSISNA